MIGAEDSRTEPGAPTVRFAASGGASAPEYSSAGSAGADLRARLDRPVIVKPGERALISTGLRIEVPPGWEAQVRPRSGLAARHGVTVLNSPGTIDSDYRGDVKIILANLGGEPFEISDGDRVAQLVLAPVARARFVRAAELSASDRGEGGFGSTGISG